MKNAWVVVAMAGCAAPASEQTTTQSVTQEDAVTYRFSGALPDEGETCRHTPHYRNSLCGKSFHGYVTIPSAPNPDYVNSFYEAPYNEQGLVTGPYGLVFNVDGMRPRSFPNAFVRIANDIVDPFAEQPTLLDTFEVGASASYSNDGFYASFADPTATAIDNELLMPDPSLFSQVCWNDSIGCPMVVGDAASDIRSIGLAFSRSPIVMSVPKEEREAPYFVVTSADWSDADHTSATISLEIYDNYTFATPTCDLWVELREGEGSPPHGDAKHAHHDGRALRQAVLSIAAGDPNPARQLSAVNVTCTFDVQGDAPVENTAVFYY